MLRSTLGQLILRYGLLHVRADRFVSRALERSRALMQGVLSEALSTEEQASLTQRIYARRETYGPPGLWPWERAWFERDLPAPPARLLVGGCGSGREVRALSQQGYRVDGFEPVQGLFAAACRELPEGARLWQLSYEDLARGGATELDAGAPYAAVILGWGSFSHVIERRAREGALAALARLCPAGPLLLSFHAARPSAALRSTSRAEATARRLGRGLRGLRGIAPGDDAPDLFLPHAGFIHTCTEDELRELAGSVQRVVRWGVEPRAYAHATFVSAVAR